MLTQQLAAAQTRVQGVNTKATEDTATPKDLGIVE